MNEPTRRQNYWRSLDELADTQEFRDLVSREFPSLLPEALSAASRRGFLKLMGASLALAGLAGCRWPRETILPFSQRPEGRVPGEPVEYATALDLGGHGHGLLVTSYDGRPIKTDGNPTHTISAGKSDAWTQASILELYDPDRSRVLVRRDGSEPIQPSWSEFEQQVAGWRKDWRAKRGAGLRILSHGVGSPSVRRLRAELLAELPEAVWYEYEPVSWDNEREGLRAAYGRPLRPQLALDEAGLIVSLDAELLGEHPAALRNARGIAAGRRTADEGRMSRIIAVESRYTLMGALGDHRYAVPSARVPHVAGAVARRLGERLGVGTPLPPGAVDEDFAFVDLIVSQLLEHRGRAVVVAGAQHAPEVHALVAWINHASRAVGSTLRYTEDPDPDRPAHHVALERLGEEMRDGAVETLLVLGANPVFDSPGQIDFASLLEQVPTSLHLGLYQDETGSRCTWHLPMAHGLESWGDATAWDGSVSVAQPLVEPLHGGRSTLEVLAVLVGREPVKAYEIVRRTAEGLLGGERFEAVWRETLRTGVIAESAARPVDPGRPDGARVAERWSEMELAARPSGESFEVVIFPDRKVRDGRFANNGWLQELPDPLTKLTWGNAAEIGLSTAAELGVETGDVLRLTRGERSIEVPVFVTPGQAPHSLAIAAGYGRSGAAGSVAEGVGVDVYPLTDERALGVVPGVRVEKTGRKEMLAHTQNHYLIDPLGRKETEKRAEELLRDADLDYYNQHPDVIQHKGHGPKKLFSLWKEWEYEGHAWGMAIDLNVCTGCSACVIACQSENNIPIVGKEQVRNGREMHWIRVDRYYKGAPEQPQIGFQPVACQHCENAPCEQVCPVAATVHDEEGLNVMVYNRCVGTRYCSNNCPYKVRRFNFFNYHKDENELDAVRRNPEVTVRSRGVMEKCTFCLQRIQQTKIRAKNENRPIRDGEIVPACAQACPTDAIVFGDLNDPDSRVRKHHEHRRSYGMLASLNVRPRNHYLGKIRNPAGGSAAHETDSGEHA